jgi:hypothetical protein
MIITLAFEKKRQYYRRKLAKIAENCDRNIDPPGAKESGDKGFPFLPAGSF